MPLSIKVPPSMLTLAPPVPGTGSLAFSELVSTNILPQQRAVQLFVRPSPLLVHPVEVVLPWTTIKALCLSLMQMELAEVGVVVGLRPDEATRRV